MSWSARSQSALWPSRALTVAALFPQIDLSWMQSKKLDDSEVQSHKLQDVVGIRRGACDTVRMMM
jgi:non-ribosomal peptide synthetase component E (peptide arylation enzyme)